METSKSVCGLLIFPRIIAWPFRRRSLRFPTYSSLWCSSGCVGWLLLSLGSRRSCWEARAHSSDLWRSTIKGMHEKDSKNSFSQIIESVFRVRFFVGGELVAVDGRLVCWFLSYRAVDDLFPCSFDIKTNAWHPIFTQCSKTNEIWVLVLEKAWAKLHGSYAA